MKIKEVSRLIISLFMLAGCNSNKYSQINDGRYLVKGDITIQNDDTVYNGEMKFINNENHIETISNYKNNELEGNSTEYYPNGKIHFKISWVKGEKDGLEREYDQNGNLLASLNFFHNMQVGPQITYRNGFDSAYKFLTFENSVLFSSDYRNDSVVSQNGKILNTYLSSGTENNEPVNDIFLYNVQPLGAQVYYDFFKKEKQTNKIYLLKTIGPGDIFFYKFRYSDMDSNFVYGATFRII
jgi:antitoxin component YwqK of YwqJK toxin-antitoxin module